MAIDWTIQGVEFINCNCAVGCPCQFNALPTHGNCRALTFIKIEKGKFGDVPLDGLKWGLLLAWPGPIHFGSGTAQAIIDERASDPQRAALEAIAQGRETDPGVLVTQVLSTTITNFLPTLFKPIDLNIDINNRVASLRIPGIIDGEASSIKNPVTGIPHRVRVTLPEGMEFTEAEFVSGKAKASGPIELDLDGTHAHVARIHWSTHGVVR